MKLQQVIGLLISLFFYCQAQAGLEKFPYQVHLDDQYLGNAKYHVFRPDQTSATNRFSSGFSTFVRRPRWRPNPYVGLQDPHIQNAGLVLNYAQTLLADSIGNHSNANYPVTYLSSNYPSVSYPGPAEHIMSEAGSENLQLRPHRVQNCSSEGNGHPLCQSTSQVRAVDLIHFIHTNRLYNRYIGLGSVRRPEFVYVPFISHGLIFKVVRLNRSPTDASSNINESRFTITLAIAGSNSGNIIPNNTIQLTVTYNTLQSGENVPVQICQSDRGLCYTYINDASVQPPPPENQLVVVSGNPPPQPPGSGAKTYPAILVSRMMKTGILFPNNGYPVSTRGMGVMIAN